jgi:hypothetical protein
VTPVETGPWRKQRVFLLAGCILLTALALHTPQLLFRMLLTDDFGFVLQSWTWSTALDHLWVPVNEHAMPLNRLTTWALIRLAGCASALPAVLGTQGPLALCVCMGLLYLFLRRELGHPVYGLAGMTFFGVTSQYEQAVSWYAATFALISLAFVLLGLLSAQAWRRDGRVRHLVACVLWTALAPSCFAGGILAGPLCALYLLSSPPGEVVARPGRSGRTLLVGLLPVLGTGLFLAVSLPRTARVILHARHYDGKTALEAFHPDVALLYSARSLVDNTLLGTLTGVNVICPLVVVPFVLVLLLAAGAWWWWRAPHRSLLLLGLGFIGCSYFLIYGTRSEWPYERLVSWSRYQVFSHLGLVLFLSGGLPRWRGWLVAGEGRAGRLAPTRNVLWLAVLVGLGITQVWRSLPYYDPHQAEQLRLVDAVDARCRQYHISASDARAALEPMPMVNGGEEDWCRCSAWDLLRGSDDPRPVEPEEVRRLLAPLVR